jgi:hypothetical protein
MKPIISVDSDGILPQSRLFDEAHKRWFYVMSVLLKDDSKRNFGFEVNLGILNFSRGASER